jgi:hypothetical protein
MLGGYPTQIKPCQWSGIITYPHSKNPSRRREPSRASIISGYSKARKGSTRRDRLTVTKKIRSVVRRRRTVDIHEY